MAKQRVIRVRIRSHRFTEKDFDPYALAVGQFAFAWSALHERLGFVFSALMGGKTDRNIALWNAPQFDRPKRKLLEAVVATMTPEEQNTHPGAREDLLWLLAETEKLEDHRNNAIHSPVSLAFGKSMARAAREWGIFQYATADIRLGHPRAARLLGKDLIVEYRWGRNVAVALHDYAESARRNLTGLRPSWPSKPKLPVRVPRSDRQGRRRQSA